ncbi:hypothetical protein D9M68_618850 [compost metagenome]
MLPVRDTSVTLLLRMFTAGVRTESPGMSRIEPTASRLTLLREKMVSTVRSAGDSIQTSPAARAISDEPAVGLMRRADPAAPMPPLAASRMMLSPTTLFVPATVAALISAPATLIRTLSLAVTWLMRKSFSDPMNASPAAALAVSAPVPVSTFTARGRMIEITLPVTVASPRSAAASAAF